MIRAYDGHVLDSIQTLSRAVSLRCAKGLEELRAQEEATAAEAAAPPPRVAYIRLTILITVLSGRQIVEKPGHYLVSRVLYIDSLLLTIEVFPLPLLAATCGEPVCPFRSAIADTLRSPAPSAFVFRGPKPANPVSSVQALKQCSVAASFSFAGLSPSLPGSFAIHEFRLGHQNLSLVRDRPFLAEKVLQSACSPTRDRRGQKTPSFGGAGKDVMHHAQRAQSASTRPCWCAQALQIW